MADWNTPTGSSLYTNVLTNLKDRDTSALLLQEGTTETNLPTAAKRYNTSTNKFERWNGSVWSNLGFHTTIDNHIADTTIHFAPPVGSIFMWPTTSEPAGFLLCAGSAVSRVTYAALFALIGTTFGAGDGSTTFNLPDFRARMPIGRDASNAAVDTIGETGGSFNHTHTTPAHTHSIATHTHDLSNHFHTQPAHTHTGPAHTHTVPAHYHDTQGPGADIRIESSGNHGHSYAAREGGSNGSTADKPQGASNTTGVDATFNTNNATHTHNHGFFVGTVGNATGSNGDAAFSTLSEGTGNTSSAGGDNTNGPSVNITGGSGTLNTTGGEGSGTSGANNPPFLTINFIIKT